MSATKQQQIEAAVQAFFPDGDYRIVEMEGGVNNTTRYVDRGADRYVLRIYENHRCADKVMYEHDVLRQLLKRQLSIRIPNPVRTSGGLTYAQLEDGKLASLYEYIAGERCRFDNEPRIRSAGAAAGALVTALRDIEPTLPSAYEPYYELYEVHPLVTEQALTVFASQPPEWAPKEAVNSFNEELRYFQLQLQKLMRLPVQNTHSDLVASNMVAAGDKVTGVLDFEFVTPDVRAMDAAVVLGELVRCRELSPLQAIEAFLSGYGENAELTDDEIETLPALIQLRSTVVVIHFLGRHWEGIDEKEEVVKHLNQFADIRSWLQENGNAVKEIAARTVRQGERNP
jgi:homoserine kinase type II